MDTEIFEIIKKRHEDSASDPIYMEGYNHAMGAKNPYKYPTKTNQALIRIAGIPTTLTDKQKRMLTMWRNRLYKTKWSRWSTGYWTKDYHQEIKFV